eukprot:8210697-Ditylum_brightwellii.AAC.1
MNASSNSPASSQSGSCTKIQGLVHIEIRTMQPSAVGNTQQSSAGMEIHNNQLLRYQQHTS